MCDGSFSVSFYLHGCDMLLIGKFYRYLATYFDKETMYENLFCAGCCPRTTISPVRLADSLQR